MTKVPAKVIAAQERNQILFLVTAMKDPSSVGSMFELEIGRGRGALVP
jgi:hypothetical protein